VRSKRARGEAYIGSKGRVSKKKFTMIYYLPKKDKNFKIFYILCYHVIKLRNILKYDYISANKKRRMLAAILAQSLVKFVMLLT